jgi:leader peptidase (prepilin peptidase) / N-methyltransferase
LSWAEPTFLALIFALGASLGSFVNVVAHRLPLSRSLSRPGSACPACGAAIRWHDNVPVLGWLLLRGRCRACAVAISARYPLVELAAGLLAVAIWLLYSGPLVMPARIEQLLPTVIVPFVLQLAFAMALVALLLIDLDWFLLPDRITLPLALLGLLASLAIHRQTGITLEHAAIGALVGGGAPLVLGLLYSLLTGRTGLGGGDWKLLQAIGAWLGVASLPFVLTAGALQALVAALLFRRDFALAEPPPLPDEPAAEPASGEPPATAEPVPFRRLHVPFGPFLALAAIEWHLFSREISALIGPR